MVAAARLPTTRRAAVAVAVVLALAACGTTGSAAPGVASARTSPSTSATPSIPSIPSSSAVIGPPLHDVEMVTAVGDSVPYGSACDCTPYPQLSSADLSTLGGEEVRTANDAVPGDTTGDVLSQLQRDQTTISHVAESGVVLVEIGANDIAHSARCGTDTSCYTPDLTKAVANLNAIVERIRQLGGGRAMAIVLLDYWSVWLGGQYATAQGAEYEHAATTLTQDLNGEIRTIATATRSAYVDLRVAFRGPDDVWDETHLLAGDGDHPNADGHARIASALTDVLTTVLPH